MITDMDTWTNIRRDVLTGGMSRREACKKYNLNFRTIQKILSHAEPPGKRKWVGGHWKWQRSKQQWVWTKGHWSV